MVISTKGRYALRLMIDLAQHCDEGFISLKTVSQRQDVSLKYMEAIAAALNRANLVISQRGKEGGYRLSRPASDITVAEVLHSTEGSMAAVSCLDAGENGCERAAQCLTLPMWKKLDAVMDNYLSGVSVQDLLDGKAYGHINWGKESAFSFPCFLFQIPIDNVGNAWYHLPTKQIGIKGGQSHARLRRQCGNHKTIPRRKGSHASVL